MEKIKKYLPKFRPNWRGALPVVFFFGASFLLVAVFFDLQFVMTASIMTVLFQNRHARYNSWGIFSVSWSSAKPLLFLP